MVNIAITGGWVSTYIKSPLRAIDVKLPMLLLILIKLLTPLRAMELVALMFTDITIFITGIYVKNQHTYF